MNITIVGLGLIGGSLAIDMKRTRFATQITGVESNKQYAEEALKLGITDKIMDLRPALAHADMVILAVPVDKILELLPEVLDNIPENTTVVDVGSAKRKIAAAVKNHPRRKNYVPSHPMSGTENSGPSAAMAEMFKGKITIICDQHESGPQHLALTEKMFHLIGMDIAYMTSDEQDLSTAFVSHLPHAVAYALANAVQAKENRNIIFDLASGGFRSTVRLAKSSSSMWLPIFQQNSDYVVEALEVYIKHLEDFRNAIKNGKTEELLKLIESASKIRSVLEGENHSLIKNEETNVKLYTK